MAFAVTAEGWLDILSCPECAGRFDAVGSSLRCQNCARLYPILGGVPCLLPDPDHYRALWLSRLDDYLEVTEQRIRFMRGETELPDLLPRTRARVDRIIEAKSAEREQIKRLFAEFSSQAPYMPARVIPSRAEPLGGRLFVLEWYEHLFRDWCWGAAEATRLCELVARVVPRALGPLAVYGAGAGRLAYDVQRMLAPERTLALDINPLPLLVAERVARGGTLALHEFPVSPTTDQHMVVPQELRAPAALDERLCFAFADAFAPPFRPGMFDAVLTPWFVDSVGLDLRETVALVNRALRPGGLWIQVGPLSFNTILSRAYLIEEVHEIAERSGFRLLERKQERLPYFDSPLSGSWREETVYCFAAEKVLEANSVSVPDFVPPWVKDPTLPIPVSPETFNIGRTSAFTAMVLTLIDGSRSIQDIAATTASSVGLDEDTMQAQLRAFFAKLIQA